MSNEKALLEGASSNQIDLPSMVEDSVVKDDERDNVSFFTTLIDEFKRNLGLNNPLRSALRSTLASIGLSSSDNEIYKKIYKAFCDEGHFEERCEKALLLLYTSKEEGEFNDNSAQQKLIIDLSISFMCISGKIFLLEENKSLCSKKFTEYDQKLLRDFLVIKAKSLHTDDEFEKFSRLILKLNQGYQICNEIELLIKNKDREVIKKLSLEALPRRFFTAEKYDEQEFSHYCNFIKSLSTQNKIKPIDQKIMMQLIAIGIEQVLKKRESAELCLTSWQIEAFESIYDAWKTNQFDDPTSLFDMEYESIVKHIGVKNIFKRNVSRFLENEFGQKFIPYAINERLDDMRYYGRMMANYSKEDVQHADERFYFSSWSFNQTSFGWFESLICDLNNFSNTIDKNLFIPYRDRALTDYFEGCYNIKDNYLRFEAYKSFANLVLFRLSSVNQTVVSELLKQLVSRECDFYLMSFFPDSNLEPYKNSCILVGESAKYITFSGQYENVKIADIKKFSSDFSKINPKKENKLHLSNGQANSLITLNGGHTFPRVTWHGYKLLIDYLSEEKMYMVRGGYYKEDRKSKCKKFIVSTIGIVALKTYEERKDFIAYVNAIKTKWQFEKQEIDQLCSKVKEIESLVREENIARFNKMREGVATLEKNIDLEIPNWEEKPQISPKCINDALTKLKDGEHVDVDLSHTGLQDRHVTDLTTGLSQSPRLKTLRLANNSFGESGAGSLASALKEQSALTLLDISQNPRLGGGGFYANHIDTLVSHPSLTELNLSRVSLNDWDIWRLKWALKKNTTLKLVVWENSIDIFTAMFTFNIEQVKEKLPPLIVKPPLTFSKKGVLSNPIINEDQYPQTSGEDFVRQCMQKGYFLSLVDLQIGIRDQLKEHLLALQFEFIYYAVYWHDKHHRYSRILMLNSEPSQQDSRLADDTIVLLQKDGNLIAYWFSNSKLISKSLQIDTDADIKSLLGSLPKPQEESKDSKLLERITSKYGCTRENRGTGFYLKSLYELLKESRYSHIWMYSNKLPEIRDKDALYLLKPYNGDIQVYPFFNTEEFKTLNQKQYDALVTTKNLPQFPGWMEDPIEITKDKHRALIDAITSIITEAVDMKEKLVVLWEGLCGALEEGNMTGIELKLANCFLDNTTLKRGLDRMFLETPAIPIPTKPLEGLQKLRNLVHLDLSNNQIGDSGISALLAWLKNIPALTYLDLSGNPLGDYPAPLPSGAKRLAEALQTRTLSKLQTLLLAKCGLWLSHIKLLSEAIKQHTTLTHLNLNENELDDDSATVLGQLLEGSPNAGLSSAEINPPPTTTAAPPPSTTTNTYTNTYTTAESDSPNRNRLQELRLEKNAITNMGAIQLLNGLNKNSRLTKLTLMDNSNRKISEDIMGQIHWKLAKNKDKLSNPTSKIVTEEAYEIQERLLLWESVMHAWNRYAEAVDEEKEASQQIVLFQYYQSMADRLIEKLSPSSCNVLWGKAMPDSRMPNTYYLIKNEQNTWKLFYVGKLPGISEQPIPCHEVKGLENVLSRSSTESLEKMIVSPPSAEVQHVIDSYHNEKKLLASAKNLKKFYDLLSSDLEKLFIVFFCIGSKFMETNVKGSLSYEGMLANASGAGVIIGWLLILIDKCQQGNHLRQLSKVGTIEQFKVLAKQLALHLTLLYQQQILALSSNIPKANAREIEEQNFIEKAISPLIQEVIHLEPKSSLEKFVEFIVAKIGLCCIKGEMGADSWKFVNFVKRLSNLVLVSSDNSKLVDEVEKLIAVLGRQHVDRKEDTGDIKSKRWLLKELCSRVAVFDYVTGNFYTGTPLTKRSTKIEEFGCVYVRQGSETINLQPALFQENSSNVALFPRLHLLLQKFLGGGSSQTSLDLTTPYPPEIVNYFSKKIENHAQCIQVMFAFNNENPIGRFKKAIKQLASLSNDLQDPAVFISLMPDKKDHLICGFINNKELLLINPLGEDPQCPSNFCEILDELKENGSITWLGVSKMRLHKPIVYAKITAASSPPIVLELVRHFLASTPEAFEEVWVQLKATTQTESNISKLLESSPLLWQLQERTTNEFNYQQTLIKIRQLHYEMLQQWVHYDEEDKCLLESKAQEVFNRVMNGEQVTQLDKLDAKPQLLKSTQGLFLHGQAKSHIEIIMELRQQLQKQDKKIKNQDIKIGKIKEKLSELVETLENHGIAVQKSEADDLSESDDNSADEGLGYHESVFYPANTTAVSNDRNGAEKQNTSGQDAGPTHSSSLIHKKS